MSVSIPNNNTQVTITNPAGNNVEIPNFQQLVTVSTSGTPTISINEGIIISGGSTTGGDISINTSSLATTGSNIFIGNQTITGSIFFDGGSSTGSGASIIPNSGLANSLDFVAGTNGWVELASNNGNQYVWVDNNGTYLVTDWNVNQHLWTFATGGLLTVPGDIIGAPNLATTGSNSFSGSQNITGSLNVTQGITGSLLGTATTASYVLNAVSSSYTITASYALNGGGTTIDTSSLVTTSSFNSFTGSYRSGSFSGSFTGSLSGNITGTSGYSGFVATQNSSTNGDFTFIFAITGSNGYLQTYTDASPGILYNPSTNKTTISGSLVIVGGGITGSLSGSIATASFATTASYVSNALSASYFSGSISNAISASYALTASNAPLYLPLAGGTLTGNVFAQSRYFQIQDLILGYGTTFGTIKTDGTKYISLYPTNAVESTRFFANGNVKIQTGGTYVDNGFKLDVSGSFRTSGDATITGSLNVSSVAVVSSSFTTNSSSLYLTSGSNFYLQNNGSAEITGSLIVSGTVNINDVLVLTPRITTPSNPLSGSIIVSSSGATIKPFFYDGSTWQALY